MSCFNAFGFRLGRLLRRCARETRGVAAIEFAMILPIMIIMLLGTVELGDALTVDRDVANVASSTADLVARCSQVASADVSDIMNIGTSLMGRYPVSKMTIQLISLQADSKLNLTVLWSRDRTGAQPYAAGSSYPAIPAGLVEANGGVVISKVTYAYTSPIGHYIHGTITMNETFFNHPRKSTTVPMSTTPCS
jgi:Flp pilus assembly protein TadG